jgi:hypothetical protein
MIKNDQTLIENILENARWAPSGDNTQVWRFEIVNALHFVVHGYDTRDFCVYDLQGHASQLAIGALLESIAIAASAFGCKAEFQLRKDTLETHPTIDVILAEDQGITVDPLFPYLPERSVQRRSLKTTPLSAEQKQALEQAIGDAYQVHWIEGLKNRWQAALLMFKNGKLRFTLPEAYPTHSIVIEWNARFSDDKIPDKAVGLDPFATKLMKWAMQSWDRTRFLNTYLSGTLLPGIELDLVPGLCCGAHFALIAKESLNSTADYLNAGRALQRFWLTATQQGLQMQPELTPLIFSYYVRNKIAFTKEPKLIIYAEKLADRFDALLGKSNVDRAVFIGRIGQGKVAYSRSLRLSVKSLVRQS